MPSELEPSSKVFKEAEEPLMGIDGLLKAVAQEWGAHIELNYHGRPRREIILRGADDIRRKIEIATVLKDVSKGWQPGNYEYAIGLAATKDVGDRRFWWTQNVGAFGTLRPHEDLVKIIRTGWETLLAVNQADMKVSR